MPSMDGPVEQQDSRGWTPILWSASNGYSKLVKQLIQRGANVHHMGQARSGTGTTMALHESAAMRGEGGQSQESFYETAWLLMAAGVSPFAERSDGMMPIEVAAAYGNIKMKSFLEGCSLFRGTLALPVPQTFGSKVKNRYCTIQPRFPFGNAAPTLWMVCYKSPQELEPTCRIPLGNARVMIEGPQDSSSGIIIIPGTGKSLKGVAIKSHTSNSIIIEIRAVGSATMPGWKTLRTLADVCKAAAVAVSCRNLDQLCAAALRQATRQMRIPGTNAVPDSDDIMPQPRSKQTVGISPQPFVAADVGKRETTPIADSAQDMTPPSTAPSQNLDYPDTEPETPQSRDSSTPRRSSMGIGKLFKSMRRSSVATKPRYNPQMLDSNSSLGHISTASTIDRSKKQSLWGGLKKSMSAKPSLSDEMPSITEQSGGGLTDADIDALSQPIPDKFWSKIGRKMSSQRTGRLPSSGMGRLQQNWFHNDDGSNTKGGDGQPARPRKSFNYEDLDDLMYPEGRAPEHGPNQGNHVFEGGQVNMRRQTADGIRARARQNGTVPFVLEEPIVPTQEMVPSGPRRSFSFDDLDDLMSSSRRAGNRRDDFIEQMATPQLQRLGSGSSLRENPGLQSRAAQGPRVMQQEYFSPGPRYPTRSGSRDMAPQKALRSYASQAEVGGHAGPVMNTMPRRSFSFHDLDELLRQPQPQQPERRKPGPSSVTEELQAWQRSQGPNNKAKRKGPAIDPTSYGGYQGAPAPEWRPYRAPSAHSPAPQSHALPQPAIPGSTLGRAVTLPDGRQGHILELHQSPSRSLGSNPSGMSANHPVNQQGPQRHIQAPQNAPAQQLHNQQATVHAGRPVGGGKQTKSSEELVPPELAHLASLRALDTGNLSTTSGKNEEKAGGSSSNNTVSQDISTDMYTSAQGPEVWSPSSSSTRASPASAQPKQFPEPKSAIAKDDAPAQVVGPSTPPELSPRTNVHISPAVPAVLFQGTKLPKIATPPTRIAKEKSEDLDLALAKSERM